MNELIPPFDFHRVIIDTWTNDPFGHLGRGWLVLSGFLVAAACGLVGNFLILRRMALIGDAISHSVLAGLALAFLATHSFGAGAMMIGALIAGLATVGIVEVIHKKSRVKQDAAIGIAFTSLFALGVILVHVYMKNTHFDADCVLYGNILHAAGPLIKIDLTSAQADTLSKIPLLNTPQFLDFDSQQLRLAPAAVLRMTVVLVAVLLVLRLFYKELVVCSFDPALAVSLGINVTAFHLGLMALLSITVVSAFEAVGAILVIAMLILPGATAHLISKRLPVILGLTLVYALLSSLFGVHLARWLNINPPAAMVVAGTGLFITAWLVSPFDGPLAHYRRRRAPTQFPDELSPENPAA